LERLSNFALVLPVMVQVSALTVHSPWIEYLRAIHVRSLQPAWLLAHWLVGVATVVALGVTVLPYGVDVVHVTGVWVLLFAIASLSYTSRSENSLRYSAAALFLLLALMTFPGLVPWSANVLYNGDTTAVLWILGSTLTTSAVALPVLRRQ
jgi:hypothetical protein